MKTASADEDTLVGSFCRWVWWGNGVKIGPYKVVG
jgi:hypothetical protein